MASYRVRVDNQASERQAWGVPHGIPEGSDFTLQAKLTKAGALDTATVTSSGAFALTVSDSVLNGGVALLEDVTGSFASNLTTWTITDTQSNGWQAGTYAGDIRVTDSGGLINYWAVSMTIRDVKD